MPTNRAAWQDKIAVPLSIRDTPYPNNLGPNQLLLEVHAWAINPADHMIQNVDLPFIKFPLIPGEDLAGVIVSVGSSAVARFKPGDRIFALSAGSTSGKVEEGGFQNYVVVNAGLSSHVPDFMPFSDAVVFPLCITTPSHGLFNKDFLGLPYPRLGSTSSGKSILIWGGASAVGSNAIQLATAAGFDVFSTSSERNFDYMKKLGAKKVFDYSHSAVISDIATELDRSECVGIFQAAGPLEPCLEISQKSKQDLFVATASAVPEEGKTNGVRAKWIYGDTMVKDNVIGPAIFEDFIPNALARGMYQVAPQPLIVGTKGLEGIQEGYEIQKKGVSARKVVVLAE